jgi:hypothetical protein
MKKDLNHFKQTLAAQDDQSILDSEALTTINGGDKEYKPLYHDPEKKNIWTKSSVIFDQDNNYYSK